jgi:glutamate racemase
VHILITDSGVGGLSVCAYAEQFVRTHGCTEPMRLTFANAAPANDYGYNSMPSREAKVETFDRFLRNVTSRFAPDSIYVACNTLSVLLPDTPYFASAAIPVKGIVETGVRLIASELAATPGSVAVVFGTQTTIDTGTYPLMLERCGVDASRVISQACPGLADTISEDRVGTKTNAEIRHWVGEALSKLRAADAPVVACLACTHYGYRRAEFASALEAEGVAATVINPNESAVGDLFAAGGGDHREAEVDFVTRYALPQTTIETLTYFLSAISPRTVAAMQHFRHVPDLF